MEETQDRSSALELVTFRVGEQEYCVDIITVKEIRGWTPATPIPHSPDFIEGVINLRGSVLPIVNLGKRLGLDLPPPSSRNVIMIVQNENQGSGFLVDAVSDILTVQDDQLQPAPDVGSTFSRDFIKGVFAMRETMVRYIDLAQIAPRQESAA